MRRAINRVVIHAEHIEIRLSLNAILQELLGCGPIGPGDQFTAKFAEVVSVTCHFKHFKRGQTLCLVIGEDQPSTEVSRQAVLRAIARARL